MQCDKPALQAGRCARSRLKPQDSCFRVHERRAGALPSAACIDPDGLIVPGHFVDYSAKIACQSR